MRLRKALGLQVGVQTIADIHERFRKRVTEDARPSGAKPVCPRTRPIHSRTTAATARSGRTILLPRSE